MTFFTLSRSGRAPDLKSAAYLYFDAWDDWGKYRTMFTLVVFDELGIQHRIGSVKIGQKGLLPSSTVQPGSRAPLLQDTFDTLDESYFSLGQDEDYYASLNRLAPEIKRRVLTGLRDCAFDLGIFDANIHETVMTESLLRDVQTTNVRNRLHRLASGDATLTPFDFQFTLSSAAEQPTMMTFRVVPDSQPPTNVHVLIGRNGVGKTRSMRQLAEFLLGRDQSNSGGNTLQVAGSDFAGMVLVSFSAFDDFHLIPTEADRMLFRQVGLRHRLRDDGTPESGVASPDQLARDFRVSLSRCRQGLKADRWREALRTLETDDLFAESNVTNLLDSQDEDWDSRTESLFKRLSSGHAIVLLTLTRLVELVDEKTLVLLDEPESHLHPPLLAAFVRSLSDLLIKRNGVAIIATHSPVVLQEVPRHCVWKIRRSRAVTVVERPMVETFGEKIGTLTREAFGFEVTRSGSHQLLKRSVEEGLPYEWVIDSFDGQLGEEAKAIVRALIAERNSNS